MRPQWKFVWTCFALMYTLVPAPAQARAACDEGAIVPAS
jgi:hypothetical protein